jgi:hypothetical protein
MPFVQVGGAATHNTTNRKEVIVAISYTTFHVLSSIVRRGPLTYSAHRLAGTVRALQKIDFASNL